MQFTQPDTSIDDQIALLRSRGLVIADEPRAKHYLRFVGYYRLAGYALPFQVNYNADGLHRFLDGVSFEDILDLYVFDRKLRLAVMDAVERIVPCRKWGKRWRKCAGRPLAAGFTFAGTKGKRDSAEAVGVLGPVSRSLGLIRALAGRVSDGVQPPERAGGR